MQDGPLLSVHQFEMPVHVHGMWYVPWTCGWAHVGVCMRACACACSSRGLAAKRALLSLVIEVAEVRPVPGGHVRRIVAKELAQVVPLLGEVEARALQRRARRVVGVARDPPGEVRFARVVRHEGPPGAHAVEARAKALVADVLLLVGLRAAWRATGEEA